MCNSKYSPRYPNRTSPILSGPYVVGFSRADQLSYARALAREVKKVYKHVRFGVSQVAGFAQISAEQ